MLGVFVVFQFGKEFDAAKVRTIAENAQAKFAGMPGLRSKAFTIDTDQRRAVNFYVWDSHAAAKAFFSEESLARIGNLYGIAPTVEFVEVPALVENR